MEVRALKSPRHDARQQCRLNQDKERGSDPERDVDADEHTDGAGPADQARIECTHYAAGLGPPQDPRRRRGSGRTPPITAALGLWSRRRPRRYSRPTMIRPTRWWEIPAPAQSTSAFARSSFVGSSVMWTPSHAIWAFFPVAALPRCVCMTAAPRPIAAIVPLSLYLNGWVSLPSISRAMVSPACCPDWSATEPN